jgi:methylated-DNA-[protein]-cysteine S-methyltransferase
MNKTAVYSVETPLGTMVVHTERAMPVYLTFLGHFDGCERGAYPAPPAVAALMQAVELYFRGGDPGTACAEELLDNMEVTPFERSVLLEVINIPYGETASYGEVAARAGYPRAARAVGNVMRTNPFPVIIPCHRVIKGDGNLGGYGGAEHLKSHLLRFEGVEIAD